MKTIMPLFRVVLAVVLLVTGCAPATRSPIGPFTALHTITVDGDRVPVYSSDSLLDVLRRWYPPSVLREHAMTPSDEPAVIVDGIMRPGIRWLASVTAQDIGSVRRVRSIEAFHTYGATSRVGAFIVQTRRGSR